MVFNVRMELFHVPQKRSHIHRNMKIGVPKTNHCKAI